MYDLVNQIQSKSEELSISIKRLRKSGTELAEAERLYKMKLTQEALRLKQLGYAVTLIDKIIYGIPEVAELRFKRDVASAMYEANKEHINVCKLNLRLMESQLSREWSSAGKGEI